MGNTAGCKWWGREGSPIAQVRVFLVCAVCFLSGAKGWGLEDEVFGHKSRAVSPGNVMWTRSWPGLLEATIVPSLSVCWKPKKLNCQPWRDSLLLQAEGVFVVVSTRDRILEDGRCYLLVVEEKRCVTDWTSWPCFFLSGQAFEWKGLNP